MCVCGWKSAIGHPRKVPPRPFTFVVAAGGGGPHPMIISASEVWRVARIAGFGVLFTVVYFFPSSLARHTTPELSGGIPSAVERAVVYRNRFFFRLEASHAIPTTVELSRRRRRRWQGLLRPDSNSGAAPIEYEIRKHKTICYVPSDAFFSGLVAFLFFGSLLRQRPTPPHC